MGPWRGLCLPACPPIAPPDKIDRCVMHLLSMTDPDQHACVRAWMLYNELIPDAAVSDAARLFFPALRTPARLLPGAVVVVASAIIGVRACARAHVCVRPSVDGHARTVRNGRRMHARARAHRKLAAFLLPFSLQASYHQYILAASTDTHGQMNGSNASFPFPSITLFRDAHRHRSTSHCLGLPAKTLQSIAVSLIQLQPWIMNSSFPLQQAKVRPAPGSSMHAMLGQGNDAGRLAGCASATYNVVASHCNVAHDMPQQNACRPGRPSAPASPGAGMATTRPVPSSPYRYTRRRR